MVQQCVHSDPAVRRHAWASYTKLLSDMGSSHLSLIYFSLFTDACLKVRWLHMEPLFEVLCKVGFMVGQLWFLVLILLSVWPHRARRYQRSAVLYLARR